MDVAAKFEQSLRAGRVRRYCKSAEHHIRPAVAGERIDTVIGGEHETVNIARSGDYVVRGFRGERYVISAETLATRYGEPLSAPDPQGYCVYPAKGILYAFRYEGEPFKFVAPWGSAMTVRPGDYIGTPAIGSNHYYRVEKNVFAATYVAAADDDPTRGGDPAPGGGRRPGRRRTDDA